MTSRFTVVPAAYVFMLRTCSVGRSRQVLLQLREGTGYMDGHWAAAVAGHVEKGESPFAAATREAAEEIGVHDLELTALCAMQRTGNDAAIDERVDYFFAATGWSGEPRIVEPHKCADLRWFSFDELPAPLVPHELTVLEAIHNDHLSPIMTHGF